MKKFESFIIGCIFGAVPVLFCFLLACLIHIVFFEERTIPTWVLWGFAVGAVIDAVFLKRWVRNAYHLSNKILAAIYIFYSICVLGFCMGVPILNFGVGILAGIYTGRQMFAKNTNAQERSQNIKKTALFSATVMLLMCCLTGTWALVGGMIGSRFESPILSFTFTVPILVGIVLTGGLILSLLQYWLTFMAAKVVVKAGQ